MSEPKKGGKRFFRAAEKPEPIVEPADDDETVPVSVPVSVPAHKPKASGPSDEGARRVANWLEERGQAEAAALIRRKLLGGES